jgi:polyisoprenoid-binding protein YceI
LVIVSGATSAHPSDFRVDAAESAIMIEARSTAGRITFGTNAITGGLQVAAFDGGLLMTPTPRARVTVDLTKLRSGNALYDVELAQRLALRRFPEATVVLENAKLAGARFQIGGTVTLHGQTREMIGSVSAEPLADGWVVTGEQLFDIRDFEIPVPSLLMLRIFPDVRVYMSLRLRPAGVSEPRLFEG